MTELFIPRVLQPGETVELQIAARLAPGARLLVLDRKGTLLGAVTPFGPGQDSQTATMPIESSLLDGKRLRLRLLVTKAGAPPRLPNADEVRSLGLIIAPTSIE